MSISYIVTQGLRIGNNTLSYAVTKSNEGEATLSTTIATGVSNRQYTLAFTSTTTSVIYLYSSQDVTVYVNDASSGSPTDTIALNAAEPYVWVVDSGIAFPLTGTAGAITSLYITNASGATSTLEFRILKDVTP